MALTIVIGAAVAAAGALVFSLVLAAIGTGLETAGFGAILVTDFGVMVNMELYFGLTVDVLFLREWVVEKACPLLRKFIALWLRRDSPELPPLSNDPVSDDIDVSELDSTDALVWDAVRASLDLRGRRISIPPSAPSGAQSKGDPGLTTENPAEEACLACVIDATGLWSF